MRIERRNLASLRPAPYNPRKELQPGDEEYEKLKRSLMEFGYVEPVILNERTGYVVGGHQRLKVLRELGENEIDCVIVDLPEAQEKALNVALNKISGSWDEVKLNALLNDLRGTDIDLTLTGFDVGDIEVKLDEAPEPEDDDDYYGYRGDIREYTYNLYRLYEYDEKRAAGYYQFPTLKACHYVPENLIGFDNIDTLKELPPKCGIHFYIDDYKFERIWRKPYEDIDRLRRYDCVITPDFSTYEDMPMAMKIWNTYRARLIGQIMQDAGLQVIPSLRSFGADSLNYCLDGIEPGGVYAYSTVGTVDRLYNDEEYREASDAGTKAIIEKLKPECVICYTSKKIEDYDFQGLPVKIIQSRSYSNWFNGVK